MTPTGVALAAPCSAFSAFENPPDFTRLPPSIQHRKYQRAVGLNQEIYDIVRAFQYRPPDNTILFSEIPPDSKRSTRRFCRTSYEHAPCRLNATKSSAPSHLGGRLRPQATRKPGDFSTRTKATHQLIVRYRLALPGAIARESSVQNLPVLLRNGHLLRVRD